MTVYIFLRARTASIAWAWVLFARAFGGAVAHFVELEPLLDKVPAREAAV
jgi:hypothetical protein